MEYFFQRFCRIGLKTFYYIAFVPLLHVARVVGGVQLALLRGERIGHLTLNVDLAMRREILEGTLTEKRFFIVTYGPANPFLAKLIAEHAPLIQSRFLTLLLFDNINHFKNTKFYYPGIDHEHAFHEFRQVKPWLSLRPDQERLGRQILADHGIGPNDWFVAIHARSNAYLAERQPDRAVSVFDRQRNCDILNYMAAAKEVVRRGGYVLRLGASENQPLGDQGSDRIIDYATGWRSDFMDIYICAKARFLLGCPSGMYNTATIFGTPVAMANTFPWWGMPHQETDLYIPKLIRNTLNGRIMSYVEGRALGCLARGVVPQLPDYVEIIENSPGDILELCIEMFDRIDGVTVSQNDLDSQNAFRDKHLRDPSFLASPSLDDSIYAPDIGYRFLKKHADIFFGAQSPSK